MKKSAAFLLALVCALGLAGCGHHNEGSTMPTGYPSGTIQQPQIMYNGQVYFYFATGFEEPLPHGYALVGCIAGVDNEKGPTEEFHGARVEPGQAVYASQTNPSAVYVEYEKGYAKFAVRKESETIRFHDKIIRKSDLSGQTLEWLEWYNGLTEEEQLAISYIPADLYRLWGFGGTEDVPETQ